MLLVKLVMDGHLRKSSQYFNSHEVYLYSNEQKRGNHCIQPNSCDMNYTIDMIEKH